MHKNCTFLGVGHSLKNKKIKVLRFCAYLLVVALTVLSSGCSLWPDKENVSATPLVIKVEDFSIFLFESSEEIYRANVKDQAMWAGLREKAIGDTEYAIHYNWLFDAYGGWDEQRRAQLKTIMTEYSPQYMAECLIQEGKQGAGLDEIIKFIRDERCFKNQKDVLLDFYSWYGANYALPHYEQIKPLLQRKVDKTTSMVEKSFDIVSFIEKETGIRQKKKPQVVELQLNMRIIGMSVYSRKKDTITTIQWNRTPEKIWTATFNEFSGPFFKTFTDSWSFKRLSRKLKKDEKLTARFKEDIPYTWEGWVEENLAEGFARYLNVRKGITRDLGEGVYVFDREYAQALANSFNPQKTSLKEFTLNYLKKTYNI